MSKILVIGSSNTDLIANVDRFPAAGETIQGKHFLQAMGGKGANQALAAHRLGGQVKFVTCLGNDANGQNALQYYEREGLDVSLSLVVEDAPTGTAMILVNKEGENCIVITAGANHKLSSVYIDDIAREIEQASMIVLQMEIPLETVEKVCKLAATHSIPVLLNVAPAQKISKDVIKCVEILVVNETEIETISGKKITSVGEDAVIDSVLAMGAKTVILTLGKHGCIVKNDKLSQRVPAFEVDTVDSTAAGDTFCGALVAQLGNGSDLIESIKFATAASAICVTRMGAQPSIPLESEVRDFLQTNTLITLDGVKNVNGVKKSVI